MRVGLVLQAAPSGADKTEKIKAIRFVEVCSISSVGNKSFANKMIQGTSHFFREIRMKVPSLQTFYVHDWLNTNDIEIFLIIFK